jgi:hypothetical protein
LIVEKKDNQRHAIETMAMTEVANVAKNTVLYARNLKRID